MGTFTGYGSTTGCETAPSASVFTSETPGQPAGKAGTDPSQALSTSTIAVIAGVPGLTLTAVAATNTDSLALKADLVLIVIDMIVLTAALVISWYAGQQTADESGRPSGSAETMLSTLAALCMCGSMLVVAWVAGQRLLGESDSPAGPGLVYGLLVNGVYAAVNFWILLRWRQRYRQAPAAFARSQVCLFCDKLSTNVVIVGALGLTLVGGDAAYVRYVDPIAGLLIAAATARWAAPVLRDAIQGLLGRDLRRSATG